MGLNELYRYRPDPLYITHVEKISRAIINYQRDGFNRICSNISWLGSYYTPPCSPCTATRSEGLVAAYNLLKDYNNTENLDDIFNSIVLGVKFQLKTQYTSKDTGSVLDINRAIGGFHRSFNNYDIRIDYVQHNICSILGIYSILENGQ